MNFRQRGFPDSLIFNFFASSLWMYSLTAHPVGCASLTAQRKQSLSSANLPTSVGDMSKTPHMSI